LMAFSSITHFTQSKSSAPDPELVVYTGPRKGKKKNH
jgi:hypothetical protein